MNEITSNAALKKILNRFQFNAKIGKMSWFKSGGNCTALFTPETEEELSLFLQQFKKKEEIYIVGACSNILIRDGGIEGVVIRLGSKFSEITIEEPLEQDEGGKQNKANKHEIILKVGCSALDANVANFCLENSITGMEFLSLIPGTIGGNIRMNAGCYGSEVSDFLESVEAIDLNGNKVSFQKRDLQFSYRHNHLPKNLIFTWANFRLKKGDKNKILSKMKELKSTKDDSQPTKARTSGSTFVNPAGEKAWKLISDAGFRGYSIGDAQVSPKHTNFLINNDKATSTQLEDLGNAIVEKVKQNSGIELKWEIEIVGRRS